MAENNACVAQLNKISKQIGTSLGALDALQASEPATEPATATPDLLAIVAQGAAKLRQDVTALSLSVNPAKATTITTLSDKILSALQELISCTRLLAGGSPYDQNIPPLRSLITQVWAERIVALGVETTRLLDAIKEKIQRGSEAYLAQTGVVWEQIDALPGLPKTENEALVQRWKRDGGLVKDAWEEFKEDIEGDGDDEDPFGENDFGGDDDFAELEATLGGALSPEERRRAEASKPLLGLHHLLHATVPRYIPLGVVSEALPSSALLGASSAFVNAFDEAVGTLSTGQDVADIKEAMTELGQQSRSVCDQITQRLKAEPETEERRKAIDALRKWGEKLDETTKSWEESAFGMSELRDAL